jgi:hypothetical protein
MKGDVVEGTILTPPPLTKEEVVEGGGDPPTFLPSFLLPTFPREGHGGRYIDGGREGEDSGVRESFGQRVGSVFTLSLPI